MKRRPTLFLTFFLCLILIICIFFLSVKGYLNSITSLFEQGFAPVQKLLLHTSQSFHPNGQNDALQRENTALKTQLAKEYLILQENQALRDQFQIQTPQPKDVLPATIVGMPDFLPGVTAPDEFIIDKGTKDTIGIGNAIIYKDNLIGIITQSNNHFSQVTLLGNISTSFTAKTAQTNALGVVKGQGNGQMILDNVVLSDSLRTGDMVVTQGSTDINSKGYPPGLIVGKISSIEKNPSNLFQKAKINSMVDITRLSTVFIIIQQ